MLVPFLLFVIAILLLSIFWELTKINGRFKRALPADKEKVALASKASAD